MGANDSLYLLFAFLPFFNLFWASQEESIYWVFWVTALGQVFWVSITTWLLFLHKSYLREKLPWSAFAAVLPSTAWALIAPRFDLTVRNSGLIAAIVSMLGITCFVVYDREHGRWRSTESRAEAALHQTSVDSSLGAGYNIDERV
ncbi:hypothetical protein HJFPF1_03757 [Paramyrothecium foliicola]|nr:hypothetical protein HJFPF1_03757 [Paramyrothecium foliicola]